MVSHCQLTIALAVLVLAGGGVGTFFVLSGSESEVEAEGEEAVAEEPEPELEFFTMEPFIVNIKDGKRDRYLKLKAELELTNAAAGEQLRKRMPAIKDSVITLLSSKTFDDLRSIAGKDVLREELMARLNAQLKGGKVSALYFTEFVIQ